MTRSMTPSGMFQAILDEDRRGGIDNHMSHAISADNRMSYFLRFLDHIKTF